MLLATLIFSSHIVTSSPDASIKIDVSVEDQTYSVWRKGEKIISDSPLGLETVDGNLNQGLRFKTVKESREDRKYKLTATTHSVAISRFNSKTITYGADKAPNDNLQIEVRAYNDGVAFRYIFNSASSIKLTQEKTGFHFANKDETCLLSEYMTSHENNWLSYSVTGLDANKSYDLPAVCQAPGSKTTVAIAQSRLTGYTSSYLKQDSNGFQVKLSTLPNNPTVAVEAENQIVSAWRVLIMGDKPGDLIESQLIGNLADQAQGDFSWVKPGLAAWDWWSGPTNSAPPTQAQYERYIDFASKNGFPYFLIDAGWALNGLGCCDAKPETDITKPAENIDMPALVEYAKARKVDLLLWVHWQHITQRMDEALDTYAKWGIKGIKVDFMERDDQEMVKFYETLAAKTADRHMLLDMHGAFPPSGLYRTYPNYITQEGVLGAEYNKFKSRKVSAAHNVKLAYTRMLLGPMDYTPGGFRHALPETYQPRDVMPITQTRRGQALAMYVVYDSPLQMVSDDPTSYDNAKGFEFIKNVPTHWDDTKFLSGAPDTFIALARKSDTQWYIGVMNTEAARSVSLNLSRLYKGKARIEIWQDGEAPEDVIYDVKTINTKASYDLDLKGSGGAVIIVTPIK